MTCPVYRLRATLLAAAVLATAGLVARSEPGAILRDRPGVVALSERLASLDPSLPMGYFELGEEVAYESPGDAGTQLARRLFVLAYELDRASVSPIGIGPSVCLALRDLSTSPDEKTWLNAMAGRDGHITIGAASAGRGESNRLPRGTSDEAILLATIHYSAQEARAAQDIFRRPGVSATVEAIRKRFPILDRAISESAAGTVCPECRNRRISANSIEVSGPARPCPTCGGNPGPRLSAADYLNLLRLQAGLAGVQPTTWSADLLLNGQAPIRDADPSALAPYFGIDPAHTEWRSNATPQGEWFAPLARDESR